ncbi:uncharacterized protein LOC142333005 isoform X2 [Lycorma delicatula]|uniref:uncharacterized protein LOC142333005 isoform X2 n=1 Tax=Lycorma delicatula TaxID=130591 RepID=UPI003F50F225
MADGDLKANICIEEIFDKMDYGFKDERPTLAKWIESYFNWINESVKFTGKSAVIGPSFSSIYFINSDVVLPDSEVTNEYWFNLDKFQRIQMFQRLSVHLKENSQLFGELAAFERDVPLRDVLEFDIPYFVQYFHLFSSMPLQLLKYIKNPAWGRDSVNTIRISHFIPFHELCWYICPSLICGHTVKLKVDNRATLVTLLFIRLCQEAGIPEGVIKLQSIEPMDVSNYCYGQSAALVFESVDLDSALDSIVQGAWGHQGLVPWSIRRVLVSEPLAVQFVDKLYKKMLQIKYGDAFNRVAEVGKSHIKEITSAVEKIVLQASLEGLEVLQTCHSDKGFVVPTAIIGRPQCLFENTLPVPIITIETFRTLEECIKLVKNSHFFTSASLWTNSHTTLQKAASFLMKETNIQTIWLNVHGLLDPAVPFTIQDTDHGVKEDLLIYIFKKSFPEIHIAFNPDTPDIFSRIGSGGIKLTTVDGILSAASKAANLWNKFGSFKRSSILSAAAVELLNQKTLFLTDIFLAQSDDGIVESLVEFMLNICSAIQNSDTAVNSANGDSVLISSKKRGVILLHVQGFKNTLVLLELITSFIAYGNSLIIITDEDEEINKFYDVLNYCSFPLNVINIIKNKTSSNEAEHNEIIPSSEVLTVNAFISKSVWLVK